MPLLPLVRYMIPCNDWGLDPANPHRINIYGLLSNIDSLDQPAYPLVVPELCVFVALTEGRGSGEGRIACVLDESAQTVFETGQRPIPFGPDPLAIVGVPFRIRDCPFPRPGVYLVQFWYNDTK